MDFRLLPAIAMQESNLCKKILPDTFNCLGLGIHARGTWGFPSFEANFEKAVILIVLLSLLPVLFEYLSHKRSTKKALLSTHDLTEKEIIDTFKRENVD